jgi:peptide deformylase
VPVEEIGSEKINKILKNMKNALSGEDDGVAIAAPQIGVPLRIFVVSGKILLNSDGERGEDKVFINPVIKKVSKKKEEMDEGCLSVRWKYGVVKRSTNASVQAYDEEGNIFLHNATGLLSQVFQHETDHLDGVLFTDKAKNLRDIDPKELKKND